MPDFPSDVARALQYPPPGSWFPPVRAGTIRLNAGYPFPSSVPAAEFTAALQALVAAEQDRPFHYLGSPAMRRLPQLLRARSAERGMDCPPDAIMVTAGAAQAIDLAARAFLGPDDAVALETPTYMEALEIFRNYTPQILGYPVDADGLVVEALAADLAVRRARGVRLPKLLYTIASFQNPTGATLSLTRRRRRDVMTAALRREMPAGVTWQEPGGGYFIWLHVPGADTAALQARALEAGVAYIPGIHFCFDGRQGREYLRLSFSFLPPDQMEQGVALLARTIRAEPMDAIG